MALDVKRIYEPASAGDGHRVLVDRLWPRGLARADARVDRWLKEIAPSSELRKWFGHDPEKWAKFKSRYFEELAEKPELVDELVEMARRRKVTLLFSTKELRHNNAVALKEYLESPKGRMSSPSS